MIETNFTPFPILITDRLILRRLETTDAEDLFSLRSNDRVNMYVENFRHSSIEQSHAYIERIHNEIAVGKTIMWALTEKGKNRFIGTVCLWSISKDENKAETGYALSTEFHGRGYMNEALVKTIDFGFNIMKLKTIEAYAHEDNNSSIQLLRRNNFTQGMPKKPVSNNRVFYSLTNLPDIASL